MEAPLWRVRVTVLSDSKKSHRMRSSIFVALTPLYSTTPLNLSDPSMMTQTTMNPNMEIGNSFSFPNLTSDGTGCFLALSCAVLALVEGRK
eukprot:1325062-Pyramimonas_sp.AAC.1